MIQTATCFISASPIPLIVIIGVHILIPLGLNALHGSLGIVFLFNVIPAISRDSCINHPLHFHTFTSNK